MVFINLVSKPDWYRSKKNPSGKVPTMECNSRLINDSLVIAEYVNDAFPSGYDFLPRDPLARTSQKALTDELYILAPTLSNYYHNRDDPAQIQNMHDTLKSMERRLQQGNYFAGPTEPGFPDFMTWPWIERLDAVDVLSRGRVAVRAAEYPNLAGYISRMKSNPAIKYFSSDGQTIAKYLESSFTGHPAYDPSK